jgi:hypothetical protein
MLPVEQLYCGHAKLQALATGWAEYEEPNQS